MDIQAVKANFSEEVAKKAGKDGLDVAMIDWVRHQDAAIDSVTEDLPRLKDLNSVFKSAALIGVGMTAAKTLFPASAVGKALTRFGLPITVAGLVKDEFIKLYDAQINSANVRLDGNYTKVASNLKDSVASARNQLGTTHFGQRAYQAVEAFASRHRAYFKMDTQLRGFVTACCTHKEHGIIETSEYELTQLMREGITPICTRLFDVYRGSHLHPGSDLLIRLHPDEEVEYRSRGGGRMRPHPLRKLNPITGDIVTIGPRHENISAHQRAVPDKSSPRRRRGPRRTVLDESEFHKVLANIWSLEVKHINNSFFSAAVDTTYVWPENEPTDMELMVANYDTNVSHTQIEGKLNNAGQQLLSQYRNVA